VRLHDSFAIVMTAIARRPSLMNPAFVAAKGSVLGIGPTGPARDVTLLGPGDVGRIIAACLLRAAAIVVEHQHYGFLLSVREIAGLV